MAHQRSWHKTLQKGKQTRGINQGVEITGQHHSHSNQNWEQSTNCSASGWCHRANTHAETAASGDPKTENKTRKITMVLGARSPPTWKPKSQEGAPRHVYSKFIKKPTERNALIWSRTQHANSGSKTPPLTKQGNEHWFRRSNNPQRNSEQRIEASKNRHGHGPQKSKPSTRTPLEQPQNEVLGCTRRGKRGRKTLRGELGKEAITFQRQQLLCPLRSIKQVAAGDGYYL